MTYKQREQIFKNIWDKCAEIRKTKGTDYSGNIDVLSNFKKSGAKYNISPEKALLILMDKHFQAIESYVNSGHLQGEGVEEKIIDQINYLGLLLCLIKENAWTQLDTTGIKVYKGKPSKTFYI